MYVALYQRRIIDISLDPANPVPPVPPQPVKHLLHDQHTEEALCGYRKRPGDTMQGGYIGHGSEPCRRCDEEAKKS